MSSVIVIPARYASSRFPGKPLAPLRGATGVVKSLIERSWEAAAAVHGVDLVVVATDDDRIAEASKAFGAEVVMTAETCRNGTERCRDALPALTERLGAAPEIVVNLQGDAPLTPPWFVEALIAEMRADPAVSVATPGLRCDGETLAALQADRAAGRVGGTTVVFNAARDALYFSKEVIPFCAERFAPEAATPVFHHVGLYGYRPAALEAYASWAPAGLETLEGLEQLRFLENGTPVRVVEVDGRGRVFWELNNPEDTPRIEAALTRMNLE
ncbi:MAG: manno-octulosonate cytidylyltransferase [Pseudomonadota bacterium]